MAKITRSSILRNRIAHIFGTGEFRKFHDYLNLMESHFESEKVKFDQENTEEELKEISKQAGEHQQEYYNHLIGELIEQRALISYDFPNSFRASFIIQLFTFLEFELRNICEYVANKNNSNFTINDLKGNSDIEKAKVFLKKEEKIIFETLEPEWSIINNIKILRNILIHHQGFIKGNDNRINNLKPFIERNEITFTKVNTFKDQEDYQITIPNAKLPEDFIEVINKFFNKLITILKL